VIPTTISTQIVARVCDFAEKTPARSKISTTDDTDTTDKKTDYYFLIRGVREIRG
jgi:hypothetical protein